MSVRPKVDYSPPQHDSHQQPLGLIGPENIWQMKHSVPCCTPLGPCFPAPAHMSRGSDSGGLERLPASAVFEALKLLESGRDVLLMSALPSLPRRWTHPRWRGRAWPHCCPLFPSLRLSNLSYGDDGLTNGGCVHMDIWTVCLKPGSGRRGETGKKKKKWECCDPHLLTLLAPFFFLPSEIWSGSWKIEEVLFREEKRGTWPVGENWGRNQSDRPPHPHPHPSELTAPLWTCLIVNHLAFGHIKSSFNCTSCPDKIALFMSSHLLPCSLRGAHRCFHYWFWWANGAKCWTPVSPLITLQYRDESWDLCTMSNISVQFY